MPSGIQIKVGEKGSGVAGKHNGQGLNKLGKSQKIKYVPIKEKVNYEFKFILRALPEDFIYIKQSLEEWISLWD